MENLFFDDTDVSINEGYRQILRDMVDSTVELLSDMRVDISFLDYRIEQIQQWVDALENGVLDVSRKALSTYLETKKIKQIPGACKVMYGSDYGDKNLEDWAIVDSESRILYMYMGQGWDYDENIEAWIKDFSYTRDLLQKQKTSDFDPTYGLYGKLKDLLDARALLMNDFKKILQLGEILDSYIGGPDGDETIAMEEGLEL